MFYAAIRVKLQHIKNAKESHRIVIRYTHISNWQKPADRDTMHKSGIKIHRKSQDDIYSANNLKLTKGI